MLSDEPAKALRQTFGAHDPELVARDTPGHLGARQPYNMTAK